MFKKLFKKKQKPAVFNPLVDIMNKPAYESIQQVTPYTMTSIERMDALYNAVEYIVANNIPGDIVECGVWKGGSSMLIAKALLNLGDTSKKIYLYDTFEGMTKPDEVDADINNKTATTYWQENNKNDHLFWCESPLEIVKENMYSTGYPEDKIIFVKGDVAKTIPENIPSTISLLRLDTDFFASTYHELQHLYPILETKGVLIIDDYGHWQGAKEATDKYFNENNINPLMNRIDYTGRLIIKL